MTIGICGLGLIGGSMAKAYCTYGNITVYGYDKDETTLSFAKLAGAVSGVLDKETVPLCDLIYVALYPDAAADYLKEIAPYIRRDALVMDLCGVKSEICRVGFALAEEYGFTFVGGHPMAGTQFSGFKYTRANLFRGAPLVIVPKERDDIALLNRVKEMVSPAGFGSISVATAEEHDRTIAFTSQLAHVVSNAYVKSPTAQIHNGFSAGSYKDMTRVAWLNEKMWTELFLDNRAFLLEELDTIITSLTEYRDAIKAEDAETLRTLLREGREAKERADG
ncbi:MAG: prephenate dehydrogenase/arogenate dehydrogenase family protein [Clostridia bacterium]|nr:prephenate dehydrogenase/arogenate dehydrogenase family protein [Clostridia bacterium]